MTLSTLAAVAGLAAWSPSSAPLPKAPPAPPSASVAGGPAAPLVAVASPSGAAIGWDAMIGTLLRARVIAVGEKHDDAAQHQIQAKVLASLADRDPGLVVGFEMVSLDQQAELDGFASGKISEADFAAWWDKTWGFDYAMYKPIFDVARARGLRMYGLNAPIGVVVDVAKKGLAGLTPAERAQIPATIAESADPRYRGFVKAALADHHLPPQALRNMIMAQAVWNETMGAAAARLAASSRVVVIAGQGHMMWKAGVPESAARRGAGPVAVVLPYPLDGTRLSVPDALRRLRDPKSDDLALADDFVLIP
ncbi:MAG: ChaN family lipoprotein [Elusimicrobia bacterium]|nr:ChaN family lipoprotein [Elusimicrobiota bacterium]